MGCKLCIFCLKSGIIGLYVVLNIIRSSLSWCSFGFRRSLRFSEDAFRMPSLISPSLNPLFRRRVVSLSQCFLKSSESEQIRLIRRARPNGRLAFWWYGCELLKFKYCDLSVGFTYRSVCSLCVCVCTRHTHTHTHSHIHSRTHSHFGGPHQGLTCFL